MRGPSSAWLLLKNKRDPASGIIPRNSSAPWEKHTLDRLATELTAEAPGLEIGLGRRARRAYGFDEVALVPGRVTINPDEVDISFSLDSLRLELPIWGSAMDGVVDVAFAIEIGRLGGLAVLNLDGVQTKYDDPAPVLKRIAEASRAEVNGLLQEVYREPVKPRLISERIKAIKAAGVPCAVSTVPARAAERAELVESAGADAVMVGSPLAGAAESASRGFNWGMATPDPNLPRGTRIEVGVKATLREILAGPARVDDGTQNFAGALRSALGVCGARDLRAFQRVEMVIAPAIVSEGKVFQQAQRVGMGK